MKDLTKGNIFKLIIAFAVPVFFSMLLQMTYNLVDTKIIGYVLGESPLAAVGSTNSINTMIVGFLNGLTNGFAVIAAQYFGAKDINYLKKTVASSIRLGITISIVLTVLVLVFLKPLLIVLNTPADLLTEAYNYIFIVFLGMTLLMLYNVCAALLRAIGDSITPLYFLLFSVTLNIGADIFFMKIIPLGVRGAAIATVLSQGIAMVLCALYMVKKYEILRVSKTDFKRESSLDNKLLSTGLSMGFMNSLINIGSVTMQSAINSFGQNIILAHTTARRLTELFMMMFTVLGQTMATFCGQNLGAKQYKRIVKGLKSAILLGWIWCIFIVIIAYTIVPTLVKILISSDNKEVINTASLYLRVDTLLYWVTAMITITRNALQGLGDKLTPVISSSIELVGKVILTFTLIKICGYWGVILTEPIVWVLMVIPLIVQAVRLCRKYENM
ncbi:MAG: MATE family efflux transporter [Lachnospira sp.]|nr:MATE family efflux transporter [Lachnospira sp.]